MILENEEQLSELADLEWVMHPIYLDNRYHPAQNRVSCLYLTNTYQWDRYIIPIEHTEKLGSIQLEDVINFFIENEKNIFVYDKKSILNHIPNFENLFDIQLLYYLNNDEWNYVPQFEDFYRKWKKFDKINTMIPLSILFDRLDDFYLYNDTKFNKLTLYREIKREKSYKNYDNVIHTLYEIENNGIYEDGKLEYTKYNIYTKTGRPSNSFNGVNYAALNKSDDTRTHYTSRFKGGALYLYDYQAFHPTIITNYLKIARPEQISLHEWLGRKYYNTDNLTEEQYKNSKQQTFFYLYAGDSDLPDDIKHIEFYEKVQELKDSFEDKTYIETPIFKRRMEFAEDMTKYKKFNYFLQCFESEINFVKMKQLNEYLSDKESKMVLYTYDSFLIDYSPNDDIKIIDEIKNILDKGNFVTTIHRGNNYKEMKQIV